MAAHVREALESNDLERFAELLSPDVHWGPPGDATPPCQNRKQVLTWYSKGREAGRRVATVTEVEVHGNAVLVGMRLEGGERALAGAPGRARRGQRHPGLRGPGQAAAELAL